MLKTNQLVAQLSGYSKKELKEQGYIVPHSQDKYPRYSQDILEPFKKMLTNQFRIVKERITELAPEESTVLVLAEVRSKEGELIEITNALNRLSHGTYGRDLTKMGKETCLLPVNILVDNLTLKSMYDFVRKHHPVGV
ncbi:MAG: hypothetical protein ACJA2Z_000031 [Candidatus Paceibacteria bacterium]|jgi:hypothetical protein